MLYLPLNIRKLLIDYKNILIYSGYMKKLILGLSCLLALCSCTSDKSVSIGKTYKLLNTYENVYWFIDYNNACLNVQLITYTMTQGGNYEYTIDKEWVISPTKYQVMSQAIYGSMSYSNKFYEYNDYYLLETYYRVV